MRNWLGLAMLATLLIPRAAYGDMVSTNFYIYADSIGLNGGDIASSTSYTLFDTVNDSPGGQATSTSYSIYGGYQAMNTSESLLVVISSPSLAFGTISRTAVTEATTNVTISTSADNGFSLSVSNVTGTMIANVSDGAVTAAAEEYGIAVSGPFASFVDDRSIIPGRVLASSASPVSAAATVLTFKAAADINSTAATYAQTVTLTASANF